MYISALQILHFIYICIPCRHNEVGPVYVFWTLHTPRIVTTDPDHVKVVVVFMRISFCIVCMVGYHFVYCAYLYVKFPSCQFKSVVIGCKVYSLFTFAIIMIEPEAIN